MNVISENKPLNTKKPALPDLESAYCALQNISFAQIGQSSLTILHTIFFVSQHAWSTFAA
jgi:hypothetical protein